MAQPSGSWRGSYMREDDIARLVRLRRIPEEVITRVPGEEVEPVPEPGERVVFGAHFDRGLGLPASHFFRRFLDFFGLQPHHLPANACVLLSCYVAFMEGYAGLWPDMSFFYVRNANPAFDWINLPEFNPAPPTSRLNWGHNAKSADQNAEVNLLWDFLGECVSGGRLSAEDLLCTYIERRVLPLQSRIHKIGHMSGRLDPTRTSRLALSKAQVAHRVNNITKASMPEAWDWGLPPYDRTTPPELLFDRQGVEDGDLAQKIWTPDLVDPADQAGDQAGDDDLPKAPDQGGQGEHNPPPSPEQRGGGGAGDVHHGADPGGASAHEAACRLGDFCAPEEETGRRWVHGQAGEPCQEAAPARAQEGSGDGRGRHKVYPGRRLWAGCSRCAAVPSAEGADAAAFDTCARAARGCRAARGYAAFRGGLLFGCASFGAGAPRASRPKGLLWVICFRTARRRWGRQLEPAGVRHQRQELEPAGLRRLRGRK
ncbi:hypothetical protein QYE76_066969 [Lolium multiflorum]|uniref:Transposase (putative) gypsy type domain-containing protein n=1 Tax=Lolium multiflorum TaxID=4521 RepID=A0AAD8SCF5_LOLMU|nr:hypothetical protein QYE76_066969 [Lolium multiflorum]